MAKQCRCIFTAFFYIYQGYPTTLTTALCSLLRSCYSTVGGGNAILFARQPYNRRKKKATCPQWNARSLLANGQELKKIVSDLENKPDIICVQESWLKPQFNFVLQEYVVIRKDRKLGNGGGVATFIKQCVGYRNVEVNGDQEVIVTEVWQGSNSIKVINFYNPCKKLNKEVLENIRGTTNQKVIWCGDFKAHNTLWGSIKTDYNGLIVEEMLDWGRLVCINNGCFKRIDVTHGCKSVLDITLVSEKLARKCEWKVSKQSSMGSDHYPIWCKIGVDIIQALVGRIPRWKFNAANWELFKELS